MKTVFSTGPGFYAANTQAHDDTIPPDMMRFFVARIEAYDGPARPNTEFDKLEFKLLPAMAQDRPDVARALLQLHSSLSANLEQLKIEAARK
jgi:hypothetical protein